MERWNGHVALITGASVGIGAAIARKLIQYGMKVIGCARNVQKVQDLADELKTEKGSLTAIKCDVSKEDEMLAMFAKVKADFGGVDICVCNAGLSHDAPILTGDTQQWREMLDVNVLGLAICSREAVKQMREKGVDDGHLVLLNSMSGHRIIHSSPEHFYTATKFMVTALTECLRQELNDLKSHIRVTSISPGVVRTEIVARMFKDKSKEEEIYTAFKTMEPDDVVDAIVYAVNSPGHVQVHDIFRPTEQRL
ncbi:LOW QUALITY PROTEIN: dehydrogenase/reductase SDR family member 11-like [Ylistrum balloti]|uniref:LOW QUALITY PROTEIN: dehydrogenase/reductase SDR family member 11-like n=1 Tax=Ylistrum balloti TaxID=509963 RepID=UPI002905A4D1|nr:LOW QUALITY PROTEIN: dehydrogenase/reductase SDR family member 11-like [Ylistrum balloti]